MFHAKLFSSSTTTNERTNKRTNERTRGAPFLLRSHLSFSPLFLSPTKTPGGVLGDLLAQQTTGLPFDAARNLRLATFGLVFGGPAGHLWHRALDARFVAGGGASGGAARGFSSSPSSPSSSSSQPRVVLSKLACDQLLFAPVATALLFVFLKITEGGTPAEAAAFCAENWWRTLKVKREVFFSFFQVFFLSLFRTFDEEEKTHSFPFPLSPSLETCFFAKTKNKIFRPTGCCGPRPT